MPLPEDAELIPHHVREIVQQVEANMRSEPWLRISSDERVDHLPELLTALLVDALAARQHRDVPEGVREAARVHGIHRREQGFPEEVLFDEYSLLRNQTLRLLWRTRAPREAEQIIGRVDRAVSEATVASLRGFHSRPVIVE